MRGHSQTRAWTTAALTAAAATTLLLSAAAPPPGTQAVEYRINMEQVERSVVRIVLLERQFDGYVLLGTGSGFVVAPGRIVTNNHVVDSLTGHPDRLLVVVPSAGQGVEAADGEVLQVWPSADLALISAPGLQLPALRIDAARPPKDAQVRVAGYPASLDELARLSGADLLQPMEPDSNDGHISRELAIPRDRNFRWLVYAHDASISEGDSGGPLVDACGRVIGVTAMYLSAQLRADGRISMPGNQFLAVQSVMLAQFLREAGVDWTAADATCLDEPRPVPPRDDPEEPVIDPEPDHDPTPGEWLLVVGLMVGALVGVASICNWVWGKMSLGARRGLVIAAGLIGAGALIRSGLLHPGEDNGPVGQELLVCASKALGPYSFEFDGRGPCVNGRTPYLQTDNGYERLVLSGSRLARLRITSDRTGFTREYWTLDTAEKRQAMAAAAAQGTMTCSPGVPVPAPTQQRLQDFDAATASIATRPSSEMAVYRCEPHEVTK